MLLKTLTNYHVPYQSYRPETRAEQHLTSTVALEVAPPSEPTIIRFQKGNTTLPPHCSIGLSISVNRVSRALVRSYFCARAESRGTPMKYDFPGGHAEQFKTRK